MKQHERELSPSCKEHVAEVIKRVREFRAACEDDVLKLCGGVKPGGEEGSSAVSDIINRN